MRETPQQKQLSDEVQSFLDHQLSPPLNRWATVRYRPGKSGRRLSACLWDTLREASTNADNDEIVVKVTVTIQAVYR